MATLFHLDDNDPEAPLHDQRGRPPDGILPAHIISSLIGNRNIWASDDISDAQIQPASLDLRLGTIAYRIRASFLPGSNHRVRDRVENLTLHEIDLRPGAVLERGCVYLVPLIEQLALPPRISGIANPKSSTGRIDVFTRVITDGGTAFDRVDPGYQGPLYAEISPRTFSILVRPGSRLNQMRFRRGSPKYSDTQLRALQHEHTLVEGDGDIDQGIGLTIDLVGDPKTGLIGFRAKRHAGLIDVDRVDAYDPADYWDPVYSHKDATVILDPDEFYILASKEAVHVPPDFAAEMVPFNPVVGEFRVHYAGFFDPGFGHAAANGAGARAVLEIRSHEVPFILTDGQIIGKLIYEKLTERPERVYGGEIGSSYQRQGLRLSKHFKPWK